MGLDLESELRAARPEPTQELVHRLEARVREQGRQVRAGSFRIAFAGAIAAGVLAALASVGGLGYAATATGRAVARATRIVHQHGVTQLHRSAARDQYRPPRRKKCRKGTRRVGNKCKKIKRTRGVRFGRPPFTG